MVLEHPSGTVAVPVDAAREVANVAEASIKPPHVSAVPYSIGEVDSPEAVIPIIELDRLLRELGKAGGAA
jgi:chemotaxis signal transduction protein